MKKIAFCAVLVSRLLSGQPKADSLLSRGVALGRAGDFEAAERVLAEGRREFPADKRFAQELAGIAYRRGNLSLARSYLRAALRQDPKDTYANDFLGSLYLLGGNLPAALKYWNRIGKPFIGAVEFVPVPALDPLLRERALAISAGQLLTLARLRRTDENLEALGIFGHRGFKLAPRDSGPFDLSVHLAPLAPPLEAWWGHLLLPLKGLPYRQLNPEFYNLRGRAVNVISLWRWDPQKRRLAIDVTGPAGGWRYRWVLDGRDEKWQLRPPAPQFDAVRLRRVESGADLERSLNGKMTWTLGARVADRTWRDADRSAFFSSGWTVEMRNRLAGRLYSGLDESLRVDGWGRLRVGRVLTAFPSRLVGTEGGIGARWRDSLTAELRAGAMFGRVPLDELFILGMERDHDLWLRGHVGTYQGRKGNAPMGPRYVLTRTGFDRKVFELPAVRFAAGPFFDTGRAFDPSGRFGSRRWLYDAGVQARLGTIAGLTFSAVYGRDLGGGRGVFYTAVTRSGGSQR